MRVEPSNLTVDSFSIIRVPKEILAPVLEATSNLDLTFRDALAPLYPKGIPQIMFFAIKRDNQQNPGSAKYLAATTTEYWQFATGKMNKQHGIASSNMLASLRRVQEFATETGEDVIAVSAAKDSTLESVFTQIWEPQNQKLLLDMHAKALGMSQPAKPKPEVLVVPMEFA